MKIETDEQLQECLEAIGDLLENGGIFVKETEVSISVLHVGIDDPRLLTLKPKPLECWAVIGSTGIIDFSGSKFEAEVMAKQNDENYKNLAPHRAICMREVTDE